MAAKKASSKDVMDWLDQYFGAKSPVQMPKAAKDWIVQWGPLIDLVLLVLFAPLLLAALGLSLIALPFAGIGAGTITLAWVVLLAQLALQVLALPGLFARKLSGWMMLFYAAVVSLVYSLISFNIVGGLIGAVISFWILFQIKSYYK